MSAYSIARDRQRREAARRAAEKAAEAAAWERHCREAFDQRLAREAAEAEARRIAEAAARSAKLAAMTPLERECYLDAEATYARWTAESVARAEAERNRPPAPPKKAPEPPPMSPEHRARIEKAEAEMAKAETFLATVKAESDAKVAEAVAKASPGRVGQAKARAEAEVAAAARIAEAEGRVVELTRSLDSARLDAALAVKTTAVAIEAAKARMAKAEAEAANDPMRIGNPFADPPKPVITHSQWRSLSPEKQELAAMQATIIDDPVVKLDVAEVRAIVSPGRRVVTRAEYQAIPPAEQSAFFADGGILVDD